MDLIKLTRLLTPFAVEGVLSIRRDSNLKLTERLSELQFMTRTATQIGDELIIDLQILDTDLLHQLLAGEANKFFLASRLTEARANQDQADNAAWQAVEHYYAAYYGVHYLLRLTGVSLTNIDQQSASIISNCWYGTLPKPIIPTGLYTLRYDKLAKTLKLIKKIKKSAGGSHQDAWRLWEELVSKLSQASQSDLAEYGRISIDLAEHKNFLVKSTAKYTPPEIRGAINYQFKGGAWIFEKKSSDSIKKIQRLISTPDTLPQSTLHDTEGLIASNKLIINLAKTIFLNTAKNYPQSICNSLTNRYSAYIA